MYYCEWWDSRCLVLRNYQTVVGISFGEQCPCNGPELHGFVDANDDECYNFDTEFYDPLSDDYS